MQHSGSLGLTFPGVRIRRHTCICIELFHLLRNDDQSVLWRVILDLPDELVSVQNSPVADCTYQVDCDAAQ